MGPGPHESAIPHMRSLVLLLSMGQVAAEASDCPWPQSSGDGPRAAKPGWDTGAGAGAVLGSCASGLCSAALGVGAPGTFAGTVLEVKFQLCFSLITLQVTFYP